MNYEKERNHQHLEKELIGTCKRCGSKVYSNQLFVEEDKLIYHFSCYNRIIQEEEEDL